MSKTIKLLSDGTIAKVGMIVVVINGKHNGNRPNTITKITKLSLTEYHNFTNKDIPQSERIMCLQASNKHESHHVECRLPSWIEYLQDVRKATSEERKQYYNSL